MKTYVTVYSDFDRTRVLYAGSDGKIAANVTMQQIEGDSYINFGGADHTLEIWENGVKIDEIVTRVPDPDDQDECE